jgi:hypothetical protein
MPGPGQIPKLTVRTKRRQAHSPVGGLTVTG